MATDNDIEALSLEKVTLAIAQGDPRDLILKVTAAGENHHYSITPDDLLGIARYLSENWVTVDQMIAAKDGAMIDVTPERTVN